jgi:oligopeptide transport system ATP-binding protein
VSGLAEHILDVQNLKVVFHTYAGTVHGVNDVSFTLDKGEVLGIVGESGCGKSVTAAALLRLIPTPPGEIVPGSKMLFEGKDLAAVPETAMRRIRGNAISMIFQDPMTALNPVLTIGLQLSESIILHQKVSSQEALKKSIEMLNLVGIPSPEERIHQYPHQMSGGMRQRVMIAMALSCNPKILIADEPTTALDVTIQAQIIDLMKNLNQRLDTSIILISHDLGVVAGLCHRVQVMYAGRLVESAPVAELYNNPLHPYTWGLLQSIPKVTAGVKRRLQTIGGQPPDLLAPPPGCSFAPRCRFALKICKEELPALFETTAGHRVRCWLNHEISPVKPGDLFHKEAAP